VDRELGRVEPDHAIAACLFGDVQCIIGRTNQRVDVGDPRMRPPRHPATDRALHTAAVERKCTLGHRVPHPVGEPHGRLGAGSGQDEHELLAPVTADAVDLPRL
jgi:hypothetical protein